MLTQSIEVPLLYHMVLLLAPSKRATLSQRILPLQRGAHRVAHGARAREAVSLRSVPHASRAHVADAGHARRHHHAAVALDALSLLVRVRSWVHGAAGSTGLRARCAGLEGGCAGAGALPPRAHRGAVGLVVIAQVTRDPLGPT